MFVDAPVYLYVFGNSGDTAGCVCVRIVIVSMIYCHSNIGPEWSLKTRHSFHPRLQNRTQNVFWGFASFILAINTSQSTFICIIIKITYEIVDSNH